MLVGEDFGGIVAGDDDHVGELFLEEEVGEVAGDCFWLVDFVEERAHMAVFWRVGFGGFAVDGRERVLGDS